MSRRRTLIVGATQSGVGKTSVALALIAAFRRRGLVVQPFKVGPDFLDPTYLSLAAGRPCSNLDGWMMGAAETGASFARRSAQADVAVVEGVMGLFDGAEARGLPGSTAEIAGWLGAPVLLVVDAHGMSRSAAALVKGFAEFAPEVRLGGVILNRVGSLRHAELIDDALVGAGLPRVLGKFARGTLPQLPSRHLGLVRADEAALSEELLAQLAEAAESCCDLSALLALAEQARPFVGRPSATPAPAQPPLRIGVARDRAFHFYYQDNLDAFSARGAQLIDFSPLADPQLPPDLDLLYLGGGYPELFAGQLASNRTMREAIRRYALAGRPLYAECGGLLYLAESLEVRDGERRQMAGVLPIRCAMRSERVALGYVEAELVSPSLLGPPGTSLRGHEFHYSEITASSHSVSSPWSVAYRLRPRRGEARAEGFARGDQLASYVHVHLASRPDVLDHVVARCLHHRQRLAQRSP